MTTKLPFLPHSKESRLQKNDKTSDVERHKVERTSASKASKKTARADSKASDQSDDAAISFHNQQKRTTKKKYAPDFSKKNLADRWSKSTTETRESRKRNRGK